MTSGGSDASSAPMVEVEFEVDDDRYPLVAIPKQAGCRTQVERIVPQGDNAYAIFHRFTGAHPERVRELVESYDDLEVPLLQPTADGGLVKVYVTDPEAHFVVALSDAGAIPRHLWSEDGVAHITAEIPGEYDVSDVVEQFRNAHPTVRVVAKRQKDHVVPLFSHREFRDAVEDRLTERQYEVLLAAYAEGYFDWPRETSGEEVAEELGVSLSTVSQHLRVAERKIFSLLFEDQFD